jgi:hypothetical protein
VTDDEAKAKLAAAFPSENTHRWNAEVVGDGRIRFCRGLHSGDFRDDDWEFLGDVA